jgi:hypothetical protein
MFYSEDPLPIVRELIALTGSDINLEFVVCALRHASQWRFALEMDLSFVLYACKARFFAHAILTRIEQRFERNVAFSAGDSPPTPERRILCEIAFQHRGMCTAVFRIAEAEVTKRSSSAGQNSSLAISEAFKVCFFAFRLGRAIEFVRLLGAERAGEPSLRRKFILDVLRDSRPPFSREFLSELLAVLTAPGVRALFFPEVGRQVVGAQVSALGVMVQFIQGLNRSEETRTEDRDARAYDDLRKRAQRALDLSRGTGQPTLRSFL